MLAVLANCDSPSCTSNKESNVSDVSPRSLNLQVHAFLFKCEDTYPNVGDFTGFHLDRCKISPVTMKRQIMESGS